MTQNSKYAFQILRKARRCYPFMVEGAPHHVLVEMHESSRHIRPAQFFTSLLFPFRFRRGFRYMPRMLGVCRVATLGIEGCALHIISIQRPGSKCFIQYCLPQKCAQAEPDECSADGKDEKGLSLQWVRRRKKNRKSHGGVESDDHQLAVKVPYGLDPFI